MTNAVANTCILPTYLPTLLLISDDDDSDTDQAGWRRLRSFMLPSWCDLRGCWGSTRRWQWDIPATPGLLFLNTIFSKVPILPYPCCLKIMKGPPLTSKMFISISLRDFHWRSLDRSRPVGGSSCATSDPQATLPGSCSCLAR